MGATVAPDYALVAASLALIAVRRDMRQGHDADVLLADLDREDLVMVVTALAGYAAGLSRVLASEWGDDPATFMTEMIRKAVDAAADEPNDGTRS